MVKIFSIRYRFTQIAVDPQIKTPGEKAYDVIFVGTGEWIELKIANIYEIVIKIAHMNVKMSLKGDWKIFPSTKKSWNF